MLYQETRQIIIGYKNNGDHFGLTSFLKQAIPSLIDPIVKSQLFNELGLVYLRQQELEKALESLMQARELNPTGENIQFNLGSLYLHTKQYASARSCFEFIKGQNPKHAGALYNCGLIHFYQEQFEEALNCFNRVMELEKDFAGASYHAGEVYFVQKKYQQAVSCYEKTLALSPDFVDAQKSCVYSCYKMGEFRKTIELAHNLMQKHGPDLRIVKTIGDAHFELNEFREAIEAYVFMTQINEESMGHVMFQAKKMLQKEKRSQTELVESCFTEIQCHFPEYEDQIEDLREEIAQMSRRK